MIYPEVLYCYPNCAGETWMPSNGTEGMMFMEAFCDRCIHEKFTHTQCDGDAKCDILTNSMLVWPNHMDEWRYNDKGWPICTKWKFWDWSRDDDGNFNNEPPPIYPDDPNQLCLPFIFEELDIIPHKYHQNETVSKNITRCVPSGSS